MRSLSRAQALFDSNTRRTRPRSLKQLFGRALRSRRRDDADWLVLLAHVLELDARRAAAQQPAGHAALYIPQPWNHPDRVAQRAENRAWREANEPPAHRRAREALCRLIAAEANREIAAQPCRSGDPAPSSDRGDTQ